ncbi:MAG TPA: YfcE family phosphodiesterase [Spirochaetota bacterium]|nr:YfcE family phosphodiesterase [Spirochaetota bacterium]HNT09443.1 YfcE family phosphodiesterase [Spirochaetota bacterium]HNV45485.1 YfcE family phosphodiesterase [Spirochaetota bacterium]HOS38723.1 YfcE family phosphodiesterase [Spirochaetota bacterium]HPI21622.1 YfcE family phosphodiesterase [Spirochaetota bacterium]
MKIGIISDTHNNIEITLKAVAVFKERSVEMVLHGGDLTSPKMMEFFKSLSCDCRFVLGNSDIDSDLLNDRAQRLGFGCVEDTCDITVGGKRILVFHGDNVPLFRKAVASGEYDYIIKGHTHFFENYVSNNTRVINPGSLFGDDEHTVAVLDTETDRVEKIRIEME